MSNKELLLHIAQDQQSTIESVDIPVTDDVMYISVHLCKRSLPQRCQPLKQKLWGYTQHDMLRLWASKPMWVASGPKILKARVMFGRLFLEMGGFGQN